MYSEEVDFCYRLKKSGWKIRFIPDAAATHIWGGSSRKAPLESFLRLYQARVLFFRKHYGAFTSWMYKLLLWSSSLVRAAGGGIASLLLKRPGIRSSANNYWNLARSVWTY